MTSSTAEPSVPVSSLPPIPPRHAYLPRRSFLLVVYPPTAGVILAWFAYLLMIDRLEAGAILANFVAAGFLGFIWGCVCMPAVYLLLRRRDPSVGLSVACWTVIGGILLAVTLPVEVGTTMAMLCLTPAWLAIALILIAVWTPRRYFGLDICHHCGYDLRASAEIGRCPECGWQFHVAPGNHNGQVSVLRRIVRRMARHPLPVMLLIILLMGLHLTYGRVQSALLRRDLRTAVRHHQNPGQPFILARVTRFDWDRAHIVQPYSTRRNVAAQLGFPWDQVGRTGIAERDDIQILVFIRNQRVVRHTVLPIHGRRGIGFIVTGAMTPDTKLQLGESKDGSARLEPIKASRGNE